MKKTPLIAVVAGSSGTGKTTLLERLIEELAKKGWRVGAIKNSPTEIQLDYPGKDSWKFEQAGAHAIAILSPGKRAIIQHTVGRSEPNEVVGMLQDVDIILMEGNKSSRGPKIEVVRSEKGDKIVSSGEDLIAVVTDIPDLQTDAPVFSFEKTSELTSLIEQKYLK